MIRTLVSVLIVVIALTEGGYIARDRQIIAALEVTAHHKRDMCASIKYSLAGIEPFPFAEDEDSKRSSAGRMITALDTLANPNLVDACGGAEYLVSAQQHRADYCFIFKADEACIADAAHIISSFLPDDRVRR
jgi:hypothetical protein